MAASSNGSSGGCPCCSCCWFYGSVKAGECSNIRRGYRRYAAELLRNEATTELNREKRRILEQQEFEERLKDAQVAAEQEQGIGMMIVKR
jgi:hypothetical protein